ncbi:MAG: transcription antitermination factor NusB [Deltaproteobacteria bacterium]
MPSRRKTREFVLQVLFAADAQDRDPENLLSLFEDHFSDEHEEAVKVYRVMKDFARDLVAAVSRDRISIDRVIRQLSHHWKLYRMNRVDRSILRMAIAEMTSFPEIPGRVTLDEAVDLGKKYGTENSAAFINGILDKIHELQCGRPPAQNLPEILARLDELDTTH